MHTIEEVVQKALEAVNLAKARPRAGEEIDPEPPPVEAFLHVAEQLVVASTMTEEGRPCRPRLVYRPPHSARPTYLSFEFGQSLPLDAESLRKLAFAHAGEMGALIWTVENDLAAVVGIGHLKAPEVHRWPGWWLDAPFVGSLEISFLDIRLVSMRWGKLEVHRARWSPCVDSASAEIARFFGAPGSFWQMAIDKVELAQ